MFKKDNDKYPCTYDESVKEDILKRAKSDFGIEDIDKLINQLRKIKTTRNNQEKYVIDETVFYYNPEDIEIDKELSDYMRELSGLGKTFLVYDEPDMGIVFYEGDF